MDVHQHPDVKIALALGSNLGDRLAALRAAVAALAPGVRVEKTSAVYETAPVYVTDQPAYYNAAVTGVTHVAPLALLHDLKHIETRMGRTESCRYGPRLIDLDIIFYGDLHVMSQDLNVPHPRMAEREFVLRPLAAIAGAWRHPVTGLTVEAMLAALPEKTALLIEDRL